MSLRKVFSRRKDITDTVTPETVSQHSESRIGCDTWELEVFIRDWAINENWKFENFADFLELVGVKTPVKLSELNEKNQSFKCVSALGAEMRISLVFGDWTEIDSEIYLTEGEETRCYVTNGNVEEGISVPEVTLQAKTIKCVDKELYIYYSKYFCHWILKFGNIALKVQIDEPDKYEEKSEIRVLRNSEKVEQYLLTLDTSLVVDDVYKNMMKLLEFSHEDISKCGEISICYIKTIEKVEQIRSIILLKKGVMQEYAIFENGETFYVFKDGDWRYVSERGIRIVYIEEKKQHVFSITGTEETINTVNPREIMAYVKAKNTELWKKFEK